MIIVSVETAIAMKCNFVTETDIKKKKSGFYSNAPSTKLNSQSLFSLNSWSDWYWCDKDDIVWIV